MSAGRQVRPGTWELVRPSAESTKGGGQLSSRWLLSDPMRTFAQSRHCAITGLAEGCDFGRRTSVARTVNHARTRADDYPRAVLFMILLAVPAAPQCGREVAVGRYPVLELLGHDRRPLAFMLVVFAPRRGLTLLRSTRPLLQVSRSTLFCVSTFGMFYALGFVPLATAAAISFTAPLIVTALAPFALGERVGAARAIAVGVGFLGAMVVVRPGSGRIIGLCF